LGDDSKVDDADDMAATTPIATLLAALVPVGHGDTGNVRARVRFRVADMMACIMGRMPVILYGTDDVQG
jgi:hypothetical protein